MKVQIKSDNRFFVMFLALAAVWDKESSAILPSEFFDKAVTILQGLNFTFSKNIRKDFYNYLVKCLNHTSLPEFRANILKYRDAKLERGMRKIYKSEEYQLLIKEHQNLLASAQISALAIRKKIEEINSKLLIKYEGALNIVPEFFEEYGGFAINRKNEINIIYAPDVFLEDLEIIIPHEYLHYFVNPITKKYKNDQILKKCLEKICGEEFRKIYVTTENIFAERSPSCPSSTCARGPGRW